MDRVHSLFLSFTPSLLTLHEPPVGEEDVAVACADVEFRSDVGKRLPVDIPLRQIRILTRFDDALIPISSRTRFGLQLQSLANMQ